MKTPPIRVLGLLALVLTALITGCERKATTPAAPPVTGSARLVPSSAQTAPAITTAYASPVEPAALTPTPAVAVPTPPPPAQGPSLTLTEAGKASSSIVIASQAPSEASQFAAFELQDQIRKISGATLPIVTDKEKVEGLRILVGESQATRDLGLKSADFMPQEYLVKFLPDTIVLMGRDQLYQGVKVDYADFKTYPDVWRGMATCYAVYDFLERQCEVRWYAPGDLGTVSEVRPTLVVSAPAAEVRRKPKMATRNYTLGGTHLGNPIQLAGPDDTVSSAEFGRWLRRIRMGGEYFIAQHTTSSLYFYHWDKIKPDHELSKITAMKDLFQGRRPELFAKGYEAGDNNYLLAVKDKNVFRPGTFIPPQPCLSEPGTLKFFAQRAKDYFDAGEERIRYFQGIFFGGAAFPFFYEDNNRYCKCPACQAQLNQSELPLRQDGKGNGRFSNGFASNYYFDFVNKLARQVAKSHPGRSIAALAYWETARHPGFELEPNIGVQLSMATRNFWSPITRDGETVIYNEWVQKEGGKRPLYLWLYYCFPIHDAYYHTKFQPFPGFFADQVAADWKRYDADGIDGFFLQTSWGYPGSFLHDQLELHLVSKLSDDPTLDGQTLIDEFFVRYYGAAAQPMRAFYELVERTYNDTNNYPEDVRNGKLELYNQTEKVAWGYLGTKERMEKLAEFMAQAKVAAETEVERQRIGLFERGIWLPMFKGAESFTKTSELKNRPTPTTSVPRLAAAAGGDPEKVDWSKATKSPAWTSVTGFPAERQIDSQLAHDGEFLYIRMSDPTAEKDKLFSSEDIWSGDDFEVILGETNAKPYTAVMVAPDGRKRGIYFLPEGADFKHWNEGWTAVSQTEGVGWTVMLALPLKQIAPSGINPDKKLYGNFFRHVTGEEESLAWSPTYTRKFQLPERFGSIVLE